MTIRQCQEHEERELTKAVRMDSAIVTLTCASLLYAVSWIMGCSTVPGAKAGGGSHHLARRGGDERAHPDVNREPEPLAHQPAPGRAGSGQDSRRTAAARAGSWSIHQWPSPSRAAVLASARAAALVDETARMKGSSLGMITSPGAGMAAKSGPHCLPTSTAERYRSRMQSVMVRLMCDARSRAGSSGTPNIWKTPARS